MHTQLKVPLCLASLQPSLRRTGGEDVNFHVFSFLALCIGECEFREFYGGEESVWPVLFYDYIESKGRMVDINDTVTCMCDYRRGLDWWMYLLTTHKHDSELQQRTIRLSLISTLYKSLHAKSFPACSVFTSRCLVTALNSGDSSVSVLKSLLSGGYPTTELSTEL
jgi:hypothetical protein